LVSTNTQTPPTNKKAKKQKRAAEKRKYKKKGIRKSAKRGQARINFEKVRLK
jgi:hypothetical protein